MLKLYNEFCPCCGHLNKHLYLEETDGWMECEKCHKESKVLTFYQGYRLPAFTGKDLILHMQANGGAI